MNIISYVELDSKIVCVV